jgi:hypothetical protein
MLVEDWLNRIKQSIDVCIRVLEVRIFCILGNLANLLLGSV